MDGAKAAASACAMAEADSLRAPAPTARVVLRYTTSQPQILPANASQVIKDRSVGSFAAGACFARSRTYPTGVYWVTLLFY